MQRKLASVQKVLAIEPIVNADAIELARINGWQCVVKKGEFQVGQLGVFFEIDAVPPDTEAFRFLWAPRPKEGVETPTEFSRPGNFRIRTMKLRGALSQGLLLPLGELGLGQVEEGDDLTESLGVVKYEIPVAVWSHKNPQFLGRPFPGFVPKTDEMRVQSVPQVLEELHGLPYVATLKYDGTSSTFTLDPEGELLACSRNYSIPEEAGDPWLWRIVEKYGLREKLRAFPNLAIQGEIVGPGIQKNKLGLSEISLFVFSVYDWREGKYLGFDEARFVTESLGLQAVDVVEEGDSFSHTQDSLLALAEGKYAGTKNEREGIVIRPRAEMESRELLGRLSFKAISNRFLLKESD